MAKKTTKKTAKKSQPKKITYKSGNVPNHCKPCGNFFMTDVKLEKCPACGKQL